MDQNIPYYLQQNHSDNDLLGWLNTNYVPSSPSAAEKSSSIWESIADTAEETTDVVFDAAKGAWTSTKNVASSAWDATKSAASSVVDAGGDALNSSIWFVLKWPLIILGVVILALYILGRSGVIGQSASLMGAYTGVKR